MAKRFKIDLTLHSSWPFGLYFRRPCWHHFLTGLVWWDRVSMWETHDLAVKHYDSIKSLPEYLD